MIETIAAVETITHKFQIDGTCRLIYDSESAGSLLTKHVCKSVSLGNKKDYDLIATLQKTINESKIRISPVWVTSHQSIIPFSKEAHLNNTTNEMATKGHSPNAPMCNPAEWPEQTVCVSVNGNQCPGNWCEKIIETIQEHNYEKFLKEKFNWNDNLLTMVDWELRASLEKRKSPAERASFCKLTHQWTDTGHLARSTGEPTSCNECGEPETWTHVLKCKRRDEQQKAHWKTCQKEVEKELSTPTATIAIMRGVWQWLNRQTPETNSVAEIEQEKLSWEQIFLGRPAYSWRIELGDFSLTKMLVIASSIRNFSRNMWATRNHHLHGEGKEEVNTKKRSKLQARIRDAYKQKQEVDDIDGSVFDTKMKIKLKQTNKQLASWLSIFNKAKTTTRQRLKSTNRTWDIRAFLC